MLSSLKNYYWPKPPRQISGESKLAIEKDIADKGLISDELTDKHRQKLGVWTRYIDNQARAENRVWLELHGKTFAMRWGILSAALLVSGLLVSGNLWLEVPLILSSYLAGVIGIGIFYAFKNINSQN